MEAEPTPPSVTGKKPFAVEFRSSVGFVTAVVLLSIFCDLLVYSVIIPVIPFRLQSIGYDAPTSSSLTGWLLVAYSVGLVVATPPLAYLAEKYWSRRTPMTISLLLLIGSQIMFMEANVYWLMCLARVLQGFSSAAVWVVAFALLCDTVPEDRIGQQLGIVMSGLTLGFLVGPPLGGLLDARLGYRAPFILGIGVCAFDLVGRLFVLEKHEAAPWITATQSSSREQSPARPDANEAVPLQSRKKSQISVLRVIITLGRSKRAFTAFFNTFIYGIVFTIMEPTLPLRLQDLYGFGSLQVGIIYLAAVIPSLFSTPLAGWLGDKVGVEWVTVGSLLLSVPFWVVLAIRGPLAQLIASLAVADFFLSAVVAPLTADLAAAARELDGIGYAHVFGAFNFAYSIASAIGPLIGGQVYANVANGWVVLMGLSGGMMLLSAISAAFGAGNRPLLMRLFERNTPSTPDAAIEQPEMATTGDNDATGVHAASTVTEKPPVEV